MSLHPRPAVAANSAHESEPSPLEQLPGLHAQLVQAVLTRLNVGGRSGFGAALPIRAAVHDLLYCCDHLGHMGVVPGLVAMETVTRLALGDSLPDKQPEDAAVGRAVRYLVAQADRLLALAAWPLAATGEVATTADMVLSRIDVERVRLDWEMARRRASKRIVEIDQVVIEDDPQHDALMGDRAACQETIDTSYIDYEGALFEAIEARFTGACSPWDWYGFIVAETSWMAAQARSLLGLSEHTQRRIVKCPMCSHGWIGLTADPDVAGCDGCALTLPISDGQADAWFAAWRQSGHRMQVVA